MEVQRREGVVCERGEVLVRLAEYGDSLGHNQVWGGSPDPPLTRAEPLARLSDRGADAGEGAHPTL